MKTINLPAFGRVTMEEVNALLLWLSTQAGADLVMSRIEKLSPMRKSELNPALKVLEQLSFIAMKENRASITIQGLTYLRLLPAERKRAIRAHLEKVDWVQRLVAQLSESPSGRIQKSAINDAVNARGRVAIAESEVLGFIRWGEACEIFLFDERRRELIRLEPLVPRDPRPVSPNLPLAS